MPLHETNLITESIDESNIDKFEKRTKVGKENSPIVRQSTRQSIQIDRSDKSQVSVSLKSLHNNSLCSKSSSTEEIVFVPNIAIHPMDPKIDFVAHASDGGVAAIDELHMFSPPDKSGKSGSVQRVIPDFFRILEPEIYAGICKQTAHESDHDQPQSRQSKKPRQEGAVVPGT